MVKQQTPNLKVAGSNPVAPAYLLHLFPGLHQARKCMNCSDYFEMLADAASSFADPHFPYICPTCGWDYETMSDRLMRELKEVTNGRTNGRTG